MKQRLLFLFLLLLGTTEISMVFGETTSRIIHTEFQIKRQVKEEKRRIKKAKRVEFFQKIKNLFFFKNNKRGNVTVFLLGLGAVIVMSFAILLSTGGFVFLGFMLGLMAGIFGTVEKKNGNTHWLVTVGMVLGFAVTVVPIFLLFNYLFNLEFD